jgi:hypothetical protein
MEGNKLLNVPVASSQSHCTGREMMAGATLDVAVERKFYAKVCDVLTGNLFREITTICKIRARGGGITRNSVAWDSGNVTEGYYKI